MIELEWRERKPLRTERPRLGRSLGFGSQRWTEKRPGGHSPGRAAEGRATRLPVGLRSAGRLRRLRRAVVTTPGSPTTIETMRAEVQRVAHLARLHLDEATAERIARDLGRILEYVNQLSELDLQAVEPTAHAMPVANVFRPDEVAPGLSRGDVLSNAPAARDGLFVVPPIIE